MNHLFDAVLAEHFKDLDVDAFRRRQLEAERKAGEKTRQNDERQRTLNNIIRSNALERHAVVRCNPRHGPLVLFLLEPSTCGSDGLRVPVSDDPDVIADLVRSTDFKESAAARVPEARAVVLAQDREVAECLRACMGADASQKRTREWDMFVALHGLRPLNALPASRIRDLWRQFVHELETRPWSWWGVGSFCPRDCNLGWRANWHPVARNKDNCKDNCKDNGKDNCKDNCKDNERSCPPVRRNKNNKMIEALTELDPWLTNLGMAFRPTDGALCLHFTDVDDPYVHLYFSLDRKLLIPITCDLAAAFELLGYDDPSTTLTELQYAAASTRGWKKNNTNLFSILCASRFFCPELVQVSGGFKGPPLTRLYSYVRSVYGNDFDAATDSQIVELKTFLCGRAFDRFPELRKEVELVKRQTEHVVRVSRIVRIDHQHDHLLHDCHRHHRNEDDVFVFLNGVLPLLSCEQQTAIARFREFCEERDAVRRRDGVTAYVNHDWIVHEPDKRICLGWDYARTYEEATDELHEHLYPDESTANGKRIREVYMEHDPWRPEGPDEWCRWCASFATGCPSFVKHAEFSVSHSYSNPIWGSDFHFHNMYPGSRHSDMANRFIECFAVVTENDLVDMERQLEACGTAFCTHDREGAKETRDFIAFARQWLAAGKTLLYHANG